VASQDQLGESVVRHIQRAHFIFLARLVDFQAAPVAAVLVLDGHLAALLRQVASIVQLPSSRTLSGRQGGQECATPAAQAGGHGLQISPASLVAFQAFRMAQNVPVETNHAQNQMHPFSTCFATSFHMHPLVCLHLFVVVW